MVETKMILHEACREFTVQTRTLELCKYVISKMTPLFSDAVRSVMVKASAVDGHMERLLHSVIVHNCDYSREGYDLEKEARNSDEMFKLAGEIAKAQSEPRGNEPIKTLETSAATLDGDTKRGKSGATKAGQNDDPDVAKRRALGRASRNAPAQEMCELFDREKVPMPLTWQTRGFQSWTKAYMDKKYRSRIDVLISKDRHTD